MTLDRRKRKILESVIKDYVETAEPVGSRAIVRRHALNVSAATVRNEMADLEEMGYLEQPHTSAGRIPSQKGFRYYVDCMMQSEVLSDEELDLLQKYLQEQAQEWQQVFYSVGQFLSQVTNYASFVILPPVKISQFQYLQLLPIDSGQALVLLVTDVGIIMHRRIDIPEDIQPEDLQAISNLFNRALRGRRLEDIYRSDLQLLREELKDRRRVIDRTLDTVEALLSQTGEEKVFISGALNILREPEFKDLEKIRRILMIFEEDELFKDVIPQEVSNTVDICIGRENESEEMQEMSVVFAGYHTGREMGRVGVIGPMRMEYWKAAGTVESVRIIMEAFLRDNMR
ncbi:MAG TPA: heat-inducible transcription repressor HrcA [Syntrophomonadaceae bacterium]|nr:heat-inducible transcription repressor HrcA [Syntrophomonadaceae bacterium]